jgi:hypothetical protein
MSQLHPHRRSCYGAIASCAIGVFGAKSMYRRLVMDTLGAKVRNHARSQDLVAPAGFEATIAIPILRSRLRDIEVHPGGPSV